MLPSLWGPHLWKSIHFIAIGYPESPTEEQKLAYKEFFLNLWKVIPCLKCSVNYRKHLDELPPIDEFLRSRHDLFKWTVGLHNVVNMELGKQQISLDQAYTMYTNININIPQPAPTNKTTETFVMPKNIMIITLIFIVVCLLIFIAYEKKTANR